MAARHSLLMSVVVVGCSGSAPVRERTTSAAPPAACNGASFLPAPADLAARGPWPVGTRTVAVDELTVEIWYPARPGSDAGTTRARYDLRTAMPPAEAAKIPDADNAWLGCDCVRDLPVDDEHGPYPVVVFFHGAASFRAQSAFLASHWASRGFVVIAPDVPGIGLAAALGGEGGSPFGTPTRVLDVIATAPAPDPFAFIRARLAPHLALAGHSLGSLLASSVVDRPEVEVRIAMAGAATAEDKSSLLVLAGDHDGIAPADATRSGFGELTRPGRSRLGILRGAGHLAFSDLCTVGADRGGPLAIARAHGVTMPDILATLATDGCRPTDAPFAKTAPPIRALTTGVLEETLHCDPRATAALRALSSQHDLELVEK